MTIHKYVGFISQRKNLELAKSFKISTPWSKITSKHKFRFHSILGEYLAKQGIIHQISCVETPS